MASMSAGITAKPQAPWKSKFLDHVQNHMDSPEFVLATLHAAPDGAPTPFVPRARYCIFRGMWGELPENRHNTAPRNEQVFESDMPTFTTDIRMEKVGELFATAAEPANGPEGSGAGGPVEAVWWVSALRVQWRIKGHAFVVAPDVEFEPEIDAEDAKSVGVRTVKTELGKWMRVVKPEGQTGWSWGKELTAHFGNMSPGMRGMFKQPPPGKPVAQTTEEENTGMGIEVDDLEDPVARKNFRVVVIRPEEVEETDLSDPSTAKRMQHYLDKSTAEWKSQETWP